MDSTTTEDVIANLLNYDNYIDRGYIKDLSIDPVIRAMNDAHLMSRFTEDDVLRHMGSNVEDAMTLYSYKYSKLGFRVPFLYSVLARKEANIIPTMVDEWILPDTKEVHNFINDVINNWCAYRGKHSSKIPEIIATFFNIKDSEYVCTNSCRQCMFCRKDCPYRHLDMALIFTKVWKSIDAKKKNDVD